MIRTQMVMVEGKTYYLHRNHAFPGHTLDGWHVASSQILVCPTCWEPWAVLKFVDDQQAWPTAQFCRSCSPPADNNWYPVPGSILVEEGWGVIDTALLAALPEDLLRREFNLHMKAYQS